MPGRGFYDLHEGQILEKKILCLSKGLFYGRGGETRTRDTRFWRPVLYQLSYAPKAFLPLSLLNLAGLMLNKWRNGRDSNPRPPA